LSESLRKEIFDRKNQRQLAAEERRPKGFEALTLAGRSRWR
jgi:hypothetical protein